MKLTDTKSSPFGGRNNSVLVKTHTQMFQDSSQNSTFMDPFSKSRAKQSILKESNDQFDLPSIGNGLAKKLRAGEQLLLQTFQQNSSTNMFNVQAFA
jgi:hypothetical protein